MISKTLVIATMVAGLASSGAMAGQHKKSAKSAMNDQRAATRQLNEQQLASAGNYASTGSSPSAAQAPMSGQMGPDTSQPGVMPAPQVAPGAEQAPPPVTTPPTTPQ
ncbi:hypothetical protein [Polymorphobacter fuscus]|uniref:Proteophosphoglycan ppg4 n=1 Tax=Sandarakinorhabdus fusca TaxID=1439888 RepID=A0A7C9KK42_9SPHN|nr:hypothetical protein [Polymorphobacter fuscus]KAB7644493.1 hypothetical protein F9290_14290 [Polymorphobacter fuscus]MQT18421.1 hypothetical protein [Polymorphobacter fuscus]NJC08323.1 hypothetical protein [Polymorphobacter fuscus]